MVVPRLHLAVTDPRVVFVRAIQWSLSLAVVGSLIVAVWSWFDSHAFEEEAASYETAAARVRDTNQRFQAQAAQEGLDLSGERLKALAREVAFANQFLDKRKFSWTRLLSDLEEAIPSRVSLVSVTLSFQDSTISLRGTALTLNDLTALVNALEGHSAFRNVVLAQHQAKEGLGGQPAVTAGRMLSEMGPRMIDFTLSVGYRSR